MKLHLPILLLSAVVSAVACASDYDDGVDRTLTETTPGSGVWNSVVSVGSNVDTRYVGATGNHWLIEHEDYRNINDVTVTMTGGKVSDMLSAGLFRANPVGGNVDISVSGGEVGTLAGGNHIDNELATRYTSADIDSVNISISNTAKVNKVYVAGGVHGSLPSEDKLDDFVKDYMTVAGDAALTVKDQAKVGTIYGISEGCGHVTGNVNINIDGGEVDAIYAIGGEGVVDKDVTIHITDGVVTEGIYGNGHGGEARSVNLIIGTESKAYNESIAFIDGVDSIVIHKGSSLTMAAGSIFNAKVMNFSISADNLNEAVITGSSADVNKPITLNISADGELKSGKYMLVEITGEKTLTEPEGWNEDNVTVNGDGVEVTFNNLKWEDGVLYYILQGEDVSNAMVANWGVFKSSQAFVNTLWGNRSNCVVIKRACDGKNGNYPVGQTMAWGAAYGQSARISGVGADYSLWGAAVGAEHQFVSGRSIGAALGYDWGTVSPFGSSDIDQETLHLALYGRVAAWQVGQKGAVTLDWSAAYGTTTSETDALSGDWEQDNIQLDARVSYQRRLSERTTGSVFAGLQYFAAEDAAVDGIDISSMQNLRSEIGVGVSYKATQKTTVYGEVSVYSDIMRHNPTAVADDQTFHCTNPGREGGTITAGAEYRLNDDWSLRGSYSFEVAEDSVEHNINAGAVYRF